MDIKNEIRSHMAKKGSNISKVARQLGMTSQNLNQKLTKGYLRYSEAKEIAESLGYKIVWEELETEKPLE